MVGEELIPKLCGKEVIKLFLNHVVIVDERVDKELVPPGGCCSMCRSIAQAQHMS